MAYLGVAHLQDLIPVLYERHQTREDNLSPFKILYRTALALPRGVSIPGRREQEESANGSDCSFDLYSQVATPARPVFPRLFPGCCWSMHGRSEDLNQGFRTA